jgi:ATP-dependent helicase/nuclease subunit A
MRLLYVALTRAADRLIVSGVQPRERKDGADPRPADSWHLTVEQALRTIGAEPLDMGVLRYGTGAAARPGRFRKKADLPAIAIPDWATSSAPLEERPPRPLAPSAIAMDDETAPPPSKAMHSAARRGSLINQLLERLAPVALEDRFDRALRWLEASAGVSDAAERSDIARHVSDVLSQPGFEPLFGPGSLGEAPLAATLPDGRVIAGTVDRLLIEDEQISVVDFKTGRVPETAEVVPPSHLAQMTAYSEALRVIFPGRTVRAALLYTSGPKLIEVMP